MTKAIELSQLGSKINVGTDDQINFLSPADASNVRIAADFDGSGTRNVYLRVAARENRRAALVFESVDSSNASTTRWALGRGDSDELPDTHFYIGTGLSGGSSASARLVIDNTGNVGIGTTNPSVSFHIRSGDAAPLLLQRTSGANSGIEYKNDTNSMFAGLASAADFWGVSTALDIGNNAALVVTRADGNVGIGTTEPVSELEVHSSTFSDITISSARTTGNIGGLNFRKDTGGTPAMMAQMFVTTEGHYNFRAGGTNSSDHAFRINANGNVGVGTDNPTTTFMVYGPDSATYRLAKSGILAYDHTFNGTSYTIANNNGSAGIPIIFGSRQAGAETLRMDSGGRLNVGNAQPSSGVGRFHVKLHDSQDSYFKLRPASDFETSTIGSAIDIRNSANNTSHQLFVRADRYRLWTSDEKITVNSDGNVGIATNNPLHKLHVYGGGVKGDYIETSAHAIWTQTVSTGTGAESGGVILKTNPDQTSSNLSGAFIYRVRAVVRSTGTDTGATWLVYYKESSAAYQVRPVSRSGTSSNHPRLRIANTNQMELYTTHNSSYSVRVITERFYTDEPDSTLHAAGADYHWQRSANNLYYTDGNVGIGTETVSYGRLNVVNTSASNTGGLFISNVGYASNQDKPYLIAGTNNHTGATDNWGTFGFQHKIKTDSNGVPRMTVDLVGGEALCVSSSGNVGLGTVSPQQKLHVEGNVRINGNVIGGVLTAVTNDDAYVDVTPPTLGGHAVITMFSTYDNYPQPIGSGMIYYDVGNSRILAVVLDTEVQRAGGSAKLISGGTSTSTDPANFTDVAVTVTTPSGGTLRFFNRTGSARQFKITFL